MNLNWLRIYYWLSFALSILALVANVGIVLMVLGVVLFPLFVMRLINGFRFHKLDSHKGLIIFSATNFLIFALIRPDGVHVLGDNGLSALLDFFGIYAGYSQEYENAFTIIAVALLFVQYFIDLWIRGLLQEKRPPGT